MKTFVIHSKKHGDHTVLYSDEDEGFISQYTWTIKIDKNNLYAITHAHGKNNKTLRFHRAILGITDPNILVDHKDKNGLNNQRDNLRVCTKTGNQGNARKGQRGTSKYKGVYLNNDSGRWMAQLKGKEKRYSRSFITEEEAALAYNKVALEYFGEFASLNVLS